MEVLREKICFWSDLGLVNLSFADRLMRKLTQCRLEDTVSDLLLFMSHKPSLSLGVRKLNEKDLLRPLEWFEQEGIPLVKIVRGGGLTYHWPGQLACYPILKLSSQEQNVSQYMFHLEEVGLRTLEDFGVKAKRKREHVSQMGLWYQDEKICSMGIHLARWVTSFGFSLNLGGDPGPSRFIKPCGLPGVQLTTISNVIGQEPRRSLVIASILKHFQEVFTRKLKESDFDLEEKIAKL
jgi:lipoate-protein ligase B